MNKKLFIVFMFLASFHLSSIAQLMPVKNVPSPEIAGLGEFGKIPVSLYTGVPEISVPLYELKMGDFSFPLLASYHLASVKPNAQTGCLGLGWNLLAGGYITRSVHGIYDEKCESNGYASGYYAHASKLINMSNAEFSEATKHIQSVSGDYYELSADEFSFSFNGYSGNFYYKGNGEWNVISDQDIKVEFNPTNGEGFINSDQLGKRIDLRGWGAKQRNNRYFNKFTLITPDGCRYEFGGLQATEYSIPYYARYNSELTPTTWRLSKVITIDNRVIEFNYDTSSILCDLKYVPQQKIVTGMPTIPKNPQIGQAGMTGYLIFPVNIKTIKTANEILEFNYFKDYGYGASFVDSYLAWGHDTSYGRDNIYSSSENPANQFHLLLGKEIDSSSDYTLRESIKAKLKNQILHSIYIKDSRATPLKTIYFDYSFNARRKLSLVTERPGNPEMIPNYVHHPHGYFILVGYLIPESTADGSMAEYHFKYNSSQTMRSGYVQSQIDSWGYYSGGTVNFTSYPSFTKKNPLLMYTQAEVLEEIIYPTGGKSRLEYELNTYSRMVSSSLTSTLDKSGNSGGLRIRQLTLLNRQDSILGIKRYYYSFVRGENSMSSGIARNKPLHEIVYSVIDTDISLMLRSERGFFAEVTNLNSPDVGYSCVIEESLDADGKSLGYIKRHFSNYDADIYGVTHYDEPATYSALIGDSYMKAFTSRSMDRGKLLSEEYYDENNLMKKRVNYKYKEVNPASFVTAHQTLLIFNEDPMQYTDSKVGTLTKTYMHACLVDSVIESVYTKTGNTVFTRRKANEYDMYKQLLKVTDQNSSGTDTFTEYVYAVTAPEYSWMKTNHILTPILSKKEKTGDSFKKETYQYGSSPIPYICKMSTSINGIEQTNYTVEQADPFGNPTYLHQQGKPIVQIWGDEGQRLIARIENVTYDRVESMIGMKIDKFSFLKRVSQADYQRIENIRNNMIDAHFYIYKYTNDLYLESETIPNGLTTFYKYDLLGRLRETYIFKQKDGMLQKHLLERYDYRYYNNSQITQSTSNSIIQGGKL